MSQDNTRYVMMIINCLWVSQDNTRYVMMRVTMIVPRYIVTVLMPGAITVLMLKLPVFVQGAGALRGQLPHDHHLYILYVQVL